MSTDLTSVIDNLAGSGLGFYGPGGYNTSVQVGAYQDTTYITDSTGSASNSIKVNNIKWVAASSGQLAGSENRNLLAIPNYLAPLQIQVLSDTPVRIINPQLIIFDRNNVNNNPVGVVCQVATLVHPWNTTSPNGSGDTTWSQIGGSGSILNPGNNPAAISPGSGGWSPSGSLTVDVEHDWYFAISAFPTSVGSKAQFGLVFQCEFI